MSKNKIYTNKQPKSHKLLHFPFTWLRISNTTRSRSICVSKSTGTQQKFRRLHYQTGTKIMVQWNYTETHLTHLTHFTGKTRGRKCEHVQSTFCVCIVRDLPTSGGEAGKHDPLYMCECAIQKKTSESVLTAFTGKETERSSFQARPQGMQATQQSAKPFKNAFTTILHHQCTSDWTWA